MKCSHIASCELSFSLNLVLSIVLHCQLFIIHLLKRSFSFHTSIRKYFCFGILHFTTDFEKMLQLTWKISECFLLLTNEMYPIENCSRPDTLIEHIKWFKGNACSNRNYQRNNFSAIVKQSVAENEKNLLCSVVSFTLNLEQIFGEAQFVLSVTNNICFVHLYHARLACLKENHQHKLQTGCHCVCCVCFSVPFLFDKNVK